MLRQLAANANAHVGVISSGRPQNVKRMTELIGPATWYVPREQWGDYIAAGAQNVWHGYSNSMPVARNRALQHQFSIPSVDIAVQCDDDLRKVARAVDGKRVPIQAEEALIQLVDTLAGSDYYLAGVSSTDNPYFARNRSSTNLFIIGSCIAIKRCDLKFDERFKLKSDYDYTLQHIHRYGGVLRLDDLLLTFDHYSNAGGVVSYRKNETNEQMVKLLMSKWPAWVKRHPRRPGEVLLTVPKRERVTL